ncbi:MAG: T9SS type A sorting domain-containing protein, partial [Polaribacter sp.]
KEQTILYPNPAIKGVFKVKINTNPPEKGHIFIYDLKGIRILSQKINNTDSNKQEVTINMHNFPKGMYIVKFHIGDKVYNRKVLIN